MTDVAPLADERTAWRPKFTKFVMLNDQITQIGIEPLYRFYIRNSKGEWDSCLEFKHDDSPLTLYLAIALWNAIPEIQE